MRSPIKSLYPKKEIFDRFSYKEQKKLGNLIIGNVICISLFVLTTIFMFITGNRIASGLTLISDIAFIVSAVIAKKRGDLQSLLVGYRGICNCLWCRSLFYVN